MREDAELLAAHEGRADAGPRREMAGFSGLAVGADDPAAVQEVPVGAADAWLTAPGDLAMARVHMPWQTRTTCSASKVLSPGRMIDLRWLLEPAQDVEQDLEAVELVGSFERSARSIGPHRQCRLCARPPIGRGRVGRKWVPVARGVLPAR